MTPRTIRRAVSVVAFALVLPAHPAAADDEPLIIATDRPSVAASAIVIPAGALQLENGATGISSQGRHKFDAPETLLRFGLLATTEVRLTLPNFVTSSDPESDSGAADLVVGVKQQLARGVKGFDLSVVVSVSLPTGAEAVSSHGYDPSVQLPWSRAVSPNWTVAGMLSLYAPTNGDRRNTTGEATFLIDRLLTARSDAFAEYAADFPDEGGTRQLLHFGMAFKATRQQQVDVHAGVGLSSAAADWLVGAGYSFRLPNVARRR